MKENKSQQEKLQETEEYKTQGGRIDNSFTSEDSSSNEEYKTANEDFLDYSDSNNKELNKKVYAKIKEVFDPEIPVDIYELGLIYDVSITKQNEVVVLMTLTAPSCPEAQSLPVSVENKVKELEEVTDSKVIITFEPAWEMSMMSDEAKLELGLL